MKHIKNFKQFERIDEGFLSKLTGHTFVLIGSLLRPIIKSISKAALHRMSKMNFSNDIKGLRRLDVNFAAIRIKGEDILLYVNDSIFDVDKVFNVDDLSDDKFNYVIKSDNKIYVNDGSDNDMVIGEMEEEDLNRLLNVVSDYKKGDFKKYESKLNEGLVLLGVAVISAVYLLGAFRKIRQVHKSVELDVITKLMEESIGNVKLIADGENVTFTIKRNWESTDLFYNFVLTPDNKILSEKSFSYLKNLINPSKKIDFKFIKPDQLGYDTEYKEICKITPEQREILMDVIIKKSEVR